MKLKNILLVVKDLEQSKQFYHNLFGLDVLLEQGGNVVMTEGLVLQERTIWENGIKKESQVPNNSCELYFEEKNIDAFAEKLKQQYPETAYVTELMSYSWGKKIMRFYDLDGHLIEIGTPV